jgi:hypothetical protein
MDTDNDFELTLLRRQLAGQRAATVVVAVIALGALAWALSLGRAATHRNARLRQVSAQVDSLQRVAATERRAISPLENQLGAFDSAQSRVRAALAGKVGRQQLAALAARLDSITAGLAGNQAALTRLDHDLARRTAALALAGRDSTTALRRALAAELAGLRDSAHADHAGLRALAARVAGMQAAQRNGRTWTDVRDGATLVSLGMVTAHIIGDAHR